MLVPVTGSFDSREVNRRQLPPIPKTLREQDPKRFPPTYVFNVGPYQHEFPPNNNGPRFLKPCPDGAAYGDPLVFRNIEITPYDLADGGGNMGLLQEDSIDTAKLMVHEGGSLSIDTMDLTWRGVFVSENAKPTAAELAAAKKKLGAWMRLIYDKGSDLKMQGALVQPGDRSIYNEAAVACGMPPLFGVADHMLDKCVFCMEPIISGALLCKHCGSRQDSTEAKDIKKAKSKSA